MSTEQVTFLCFKCHCTFATEEMFSMHACVEVKQEIADPRAPLVVQEISELIVEGSDPNAKIESKEDIPLGRPKRTIKPRKLEIPEPPSNLLESYYNMELTEESINHILKYIDELCIYVNNVDQDMERSTEVNNNLNNAVNCYRAKLTEMKQKPEELDEPDDFKYEFDPPDFLENFSTITKKKKKKKGLKSNILNRKPGKIGTKRKAAPGKKCVGRPKKDRPDEIIEDAKLFPFVKTGENDKRFYCAICPQSYNGRRHLLTHLNQNHFTEIKEKIASTPIDPTVNANTNLKEDCERKICRNLFGTKRKNLWCRQCTVLASIRKRPVKKEGDESKENKVYKLCPECGKSVQNLKGHLNNVHYKVTQICPHCARDLPSVNSLREHIKKVHEKVPCVQCGRLVAVALMKRHIESKHTPEDQKKFKCEVCGKGFSVKENFLDHKNIHTGEKPYKCKFCSACFASKGTHAGHQRSHLGHRRNYSKH